MSSVTTPSVVRQIGSLFAGGSVVGLTDRQLIERFNNRRDATGEAAFAALVTRHGPMIMHVCRQILDDHHAEDAFQAVFLVLACKARSIRDPDKLGNWLYGVALRTARKARGRLARRNKYEVGGFMRHPGSGSGLPVEPMVQPAEQRALAREQAEVLHREIDRLPGPFRLPIVLCYFEGLTLDEAAHRLRCPAGTVRSRLARACDKLRRGLTRRGVALSGAGLVAALSSTSASTSISSPLCDITTRAANQFAAGQAASPLVVSFAKEVLRAMFVHKLRLIATTFLLLAEVATGAGYLTHSLASEDKPKQQPDAPRPQVATKTDAPNGAAPGRMFIAGRVLDPQGKPVSNAAVMAYARLLNQPGHVIGQAQSDGSGFFRLNTPRTSSERHEGVGAGALAPGYGAGWVELDPDAQQLTADIILQPEQVILGRLFDLQGRPARDVTISVDAIRRILQPETNNVRERSEGPVFGWGDVNALPGWPKPAITDADGRFTIHGIGRGRRASLIIRDPRYAQQNIRIETDDNPESKQLTLALQPAQIISGRVTYADTGKPVSHAHLLTGSDKEGSGRRSGSTGFETDDQGRFRANPPPGDHFGVGAYPPNGQPYLSIWKDFAWPKGAVEYSVDLALPRGVVIRGKLTEQGSGKAIAGAQVMFNSHPRPDANLGSFNAQTETAADGSYQLTVPPGPGYLAIQAPSKDYVLQAIAEHLLFEGRPGGRRAYFNAFSSCDPKPGNPDLQVNVMLRRGVTITGQVIGPDGQPVQDSWMISRVTLGPLGRTRPLWQGSQHGNTRNGQFEIHGLDPDTEVPVYFLEPNRKLGVTAHFSGKSASGGPVTVRLEPSVAAKARLVDPDGKPVGGFSKPWLISMVVTPGPFNSIKARKEGLLLADEARLIAVDPINYEHNPVSDAQGRITFPALIPGATYRIIDRTPFRGPDGPQHRKDFTVKPGETLDLGDILIEKPQA